MRLANSKKENRRSKKKLLIIYYFLIALFIFSFSFVGCGKKEKLTEIDFKATIEITEEKETELPIINISVGSMVTPKEGYAYYKELLDYIGQKMNLKVNFIEKRSYAEVNALLESGKIDVAFVCGGPYVEGHDKFGLELLVAPQVRGETLYYSYIIVHKDSEIDKFENLKGKTFAFADPMSNTGKLAPTYMLAKMGEKPESFFKEYIFTYAHDKSIKAVAQGIVDGAAVDSLIWEYMNQKGSRDTKDTKIIKISSPYGIPPVVVRPGLDEDLKEKLRNVFLSMDKDEAGRRILNGMFIDRFVDIDDSAYDSIREIKRWVEE